MVYVAKARNEIDAGYHIYNKARRAWAQKPYNEEPKAEQDHTVENVPSEAPSLTHPAKKKKQKTEEGNVAEKV